MESGQRRGNLPIHNRGRMGICRLILTDEVPQYWEQLKPYFEKAIAKGDGSITLENTYKGLTEGTQYALICPYGAATLLNSKAPDGENVLLLGLLTSEPGTFKFWIDEFEKTALAVAAWLDIPTLEIQGRKGWARYLKSRGVTIENERLRKYVRRRN